MHFDSSVHVRVRLQMWNSQAMREISLIYFKTPFVFFWWFFSDKILKIVTYRTAVFIFHQRRCSYHIRQRMLMLWLKNKIFCNSLSVFLSIQNCALTLWRSGLSSLYAYRMLFSVSGCALLFTRPCLAERDKVNAFPDEAETCSSDPPSGIFQLFIWRKWERFVKVERAFGF